jgi:hypothetical protein
MDRRSIGLMVFIASAWGSDVESGALLARVRAKVADDAKRIPRYVCRERIERQTFRAESNKPGDCGAIIWRSLNSRPVDARLATMDRAKLDVILSEGSELFSWPGRHRFDAASPADLISGGLSGSGDFASFRLDVFMLDGVAIKYEGRCENANCLRFSYDVPLNVTQYVFRTPYRDVKIGYHGTFDADPDTAEVLRLAVTATDVESILPGACEIDTRMTYARAASDGGEFMIPAVTERHLLRSDGMRFENKLSYEDCRQYSSESVVTFDGDAREPKSADVPARTPAVPAVGTELRLRLITNIDSDSNFAGDTVVGALTESVRDTSGGRIKSGTIVRGHISQMEKVSWPHREIVMAIRFDSMVVGGVEVPVVLERLGKRDARGRGLFVFPDTRVVLGERFITRWRVGAAP